MLKNIKHISILSIATIYILQLCFVFSGTLIENIQELRHQNQISKNLMAEHMEFSLRDWQLLDNKKEIKINNTFYDVISFRNSSKKVVVKVVKDDFENEFRISFQNLFNKKNTTDSGKKKSFNPYNYLTVISNETKTHSVLFLYFFSKSNLSFFKVKTNKIIEFIYRPPC
jgi:hypothetical protein